MPVPSFVQSLGAATNTTLACTPGAELWVSPGGSYALTYWISAGFCPEAGSVNVGPMVTPRGGSVEAAATFFTGGWTGATVFQDTRPAQGLDGGSTGGGVSGSVTLQPFEFTTEQQAEVYSSLGVVFGALLGALCLVWGYRQIMRILAAGPSTGVD